MSDGTLSGVIEFYKEASARGVKPIIGMEAYVAARTYRDSISSCPQPRSERLMAYCLAGLAAVAARDGRRERAALLWGAVEMVERKLGVQLLAFERPRYERWLRGAGTALDAGDEDARLPTTKLTVDDAVAYALQDI